MQILTADRYWSHHIHKHICLTTPLLMRSCIQHLTNAKRGEKPEWQNDLLCDLGHAVHVVFGNLLWHDAAHSQLELQQRRPQLVVLRDREMGRLGLEQRRGEMERGRRGEEGEKKTTRIRSVSSFWNQKTLKNWRHRRSKYGAAGWEERENKKRQQKEKWRAALWSTSPSWGSVTRDPPLHQENIKLTSRAAGNRWRWRSMDQCFISEEQFQNRPANDSVPYNLERPLVLIYSTSISIRKKNNKHQMHLQTDM